MINTRSVWLSAKTRAVRGFLGMTGILGLATTFMFSPGELSLSSCLFRELTGYSCFTCGLTRSLHAFSHGHPIASLHFHLLGPLLFAGVVLTSSLWIVEAWTGRRIWSRTHSRISEYVVLAFAMLWIVYGVGRIVTEFLA